ncbi:isocitrate lyase/phosphoenolpyruvate mutase family protein [Stenotrophomonas sp.]|uniref:isocitrate lyase/phosphoenolpyruvate mutase family protein n=1 Tax=Stenotrophomonas sp. TaxID=69392 RepID=UPI0028969AAC|nr:isocitrate lyase/phosphoenolpyruvate mutase family protein [Stenotrophomonas sp.]
MNDLPHRFAGLHRSADLLMLPTVCDAGSACLAEDCGAHALGTSSAAMAWSCGHADACVLPEAALLERVRQILRVTTLPLTVDMENGYSDDPRQVAARVQRLQACAQAGADGGFVPGLQALAEVAAVAAQVALPLNLMALPGLAPADLLRQAGVRRLSAGPALFLQAWAATAAATRALLQGGVLMGADGVSYADVDRRFAMNAEVG